MSCYAAFLISTETEKVGRFIEGHNFGIKLSMAREIKTGATFQQVEIAQRIERICGQGREIVKAKMPRHSGGLQWCLI